jgi:hypothetical protein
LPLLFLPRQLAIPFLVAFLFGLLLKFPLRTLIVFPETDFLRLSLIALTLWLSVFMVVANFAAPRNKLLMLAMKLLVLFLFLRFFSTSTLLFYVFFEASLIPIFWIVLA